MCFARPIYLLRMVAWEQQSAIIASFVEAKPLHDDPSHDLERLPSNQSSCQENLQSRLLWPESLAPSVRHSAISRPSKWIRAHVPRITTFVSDPLVTNAFLCFRFEGLQRLQKLEELHAPSSMRSLKSLIDLLN